MRKLRFVLAVGAAAAGLVIASGVPAQASDVEAVTCGQTVATSVTLAADLNCTGPGIIIGANDIVIDLDGHTITATENAITDSRYSDPGAHSGWTVRNGTISGRVLMESSTAVTLSRVRVLGNLDTRYHSTVTIKGGEVSGQIYVRYNESLTMAGTKIGSLAATEGKNISCTYCTILGGMHLFESNTITVRRSIVKGGIDLSITNGQTSSPNTISDNQISDATYGVAVSMSYHTIITGNTFHNNMYGVWASQLQWDTVVSDNRFIDNGAAGVYSYGFTTDTGHPMTIANNTFRHNGWDPGGATDRNGNAIADGIHIIKSPITDLPTVVNGNVTRDSAAYGIYAEPGIALNNGAPNKSRNDRLGCSGIVCS